MTELADEERPWRVRRQRRASVTLVIVVLALAGAFYYASTYFRDTTPQPVACTTVVPTQELQPRDVSIRVYNATNRAGLAAATAKLAGSRGFKVKEVANDPLKKSVKAPAELRHGPHGLESAKVLAKHIPGAVLVADKRQDDTVDLVLGNGWKAFGPAPKPTIVTPTAPPCDTLTVTVRP